MEFLKANITVPVKFVSAGQFISDQPWVHKKRVIDSYELIIGINETLYIEHNRVKYEVKPGDIMLIVPGAVHLGYAESASHLSFYWCHFYCQGFHEMVSKQDIREQIGMQPLNNQIRQQYNSEVYVPLFFSSPSIDRINILFHQLLHVANSNYYTLHSAHYMLTMLLIEVSQQVLNRYFTPTKPHLQDIHLSKIQEWVRVNALKELTVSKIADQFNYNKDYLSRTFKRKTGVNLMSYIHDIKMTKAKELLTNTTMNVKEVAHHVGFSDEKYFMRLFKKYEKMTPSEFRNAYYLTHMNIN